MPRTDFNDRLQALRDLLQEERAHTQDELRLSLEGLDFVVNQSTISRDLKRLGAIKESDSEGRTIYRLAEDPPPARVVPTLAALIQSIEHNGTLIVVRTDAGSASLVARQIDTLKLDSVMGTIAGDDTILVIPAQNKKTMAVVKELEAAL